VLAAPLNAWTDRLAYVVVPFILDFRTLPYLPLRLVPLAQGRFPARFS
jgi:hypothetical protein